MVRERVYLEKTDNCEYKFCEIRLNAKQVWFNFGEIGSKGKKKTFTFKTSSEAEFFYQEKVEEMIFNNGYQPAVKGYRPSKKKVTDGQLYFNFYG